MPYVAPYVQVAADQLMENPAFMRMTRDFLAMRREGRQNVIASLLTGGRAGGIGRVTEANMRGPDMSQLERLQDERADLLNNAIKARASGLGAATKAAVANTDFAKVLLSSSATVDAATAAATAVKYSSDIDRLRDIEKDNVELLKNDKGLLSTLRRLYDPNAPETPATKAVRDMQAINKGAMSEQASKAKLVEYLGPNAPYTPAEKAALRVGLQEKGYTTEDFAAAEVPLAGPEEAVFANEMSAATQYAKAQKALTDTALELADRMKKQGVGARSAMTKFQALGDDVTVATNLNKQMQALAYGNPAAFKELMDAAKDPLTPEAKQRLKEIEDEAAQIKAASGGKLRNDFKTDLRLNKSVKALTQEAIYDAYSKKIEAVSADDPNAEQTRAKLEQQRDALAQDIAGRGGKRVERALLSAQRRFQRGQLATEVDVEGDVTRTKQRNVVAGPNDRAITMASLKRQSTDRMDAGAPGPEEIEAVQGAKELEADLGVGQGAAPVQAKRPVGRPPVASAPPAASTKKPEEDDEGEEEAPPTEDTASLWRRPAANPFAKGVNKADLVSRRLEALRDGKV